MAKRATEILTAKEIGSMLEACGGGVMGDRNRAIIVVFWRGGLRCRELIHLAVRDLDRDRKTLAVRKGKGSVQRTVALDRMAWAIVDLWLAERATVIGDSRMRPLFCTRKGAPLLPSYLRTMISRIGRKAGIEKRVHPHAFRHTFAVELMRERMPLRDISDALGHSNVATTDIYLRRHGASEVVDRLAARS